MSENTLILVVGPYFQKLPFAAWLSSRLPDTMRVRVCETQKDYSKYPGAQYVLHVTHPILYAEKMIEETETHFPGIPLLPVITTQGYTHDPEAHLRKILTQFPRATIIQSFGVHIDIIAETIKYDLKVLSEDSSL